jgi:hypothetical protein
MTMKELLPLLVEAGFDLGGEPTPVELMGLVAVEMLTAAGRRRLREERFISGADINDGDTVHIEQIGDSLMRLYYIDETDGLRQITSDNLEEILGFLSKATGHDLTRPPPSV